VLVAFRFSNQSRLSGLLSEISDPTSPLYHHYLTAAQFDSEFSPPAAAYGGAMEYFASHGALNITTFRDRAALAFTAPTAAVERMFDTSMATFAFQNKTYYAPSAAPRLPAPLAGAVAAVEGLSSFPPITIDSLHAASAQILPPRAATKGASSPPSPSSYLAPSYWGGTQLEYGPDLQVTYDEPALFSESGYPTGMVVATILWGGTSSAAKPLGAFVPSDIFSFFNETLPVGEPHPHVYGVPINGAPPPGPSASFDVTEAQLENTIDLEMVGSTAPGASIYNVYGPVISVANLDQAFAFILNPNASERGLDNVSVITNSWGYYDHNDSAWYQDLEEAQARGISVLACSGDSADNPSSPKWFGGPDYLWYPSSMAYSSFGVTAVGGTTVTLDSNPSSPGFLHLTSQTVWNDSTVPVGSTGGLSSVFQQPSWQQAALGEASGREAPDVAAVANNTLLTLSINGFQYHASNATYGGPFQWAWGTSIASPLDAGIIAEIDHVLAAHGQPRLGFLDPQLYGIASTEFAHLDPTGTRVPDPTLRYGPEIPAAFIDVTAGANYRYAARPGYDLVTGWGSIDAYNLTVDLLSVFQVTFTESGLPNGTAWAVTLAGARESSTNRTIGFSEPNGTYPYDLGTVPGWTTARFAGSVAVSGLAVSEMVAWAEKTYPVAFTRTVLPSGTLWWINVTGGPSTSSRNESLTCVVPNGTYRYSVATTDRTYTSPGGTFMIDGSSASEAVTFTRVLYPVTFTESGLGRTGPGTNWSVTLGGVTIPSNHSTIVFTEPNGTYPYVLGEVPGFTTANFTGSVRVNGTGASVTIRWTVVTYPLTFTEVGLPNGTAWGVDLASPSGPPSSGNSSTPTISFSEPNVTLRYSPVTANKTFSAPGSSVTVNGAAAAVTVTFTLVAYPVTFWETGLPSGTLWSVTFGGRTVSGIGTLTTPEVTNGTYPYTVGSVAGYTASPSNGSVAVRGVAPSQAIAFTPSSATYLGLPATEGYGLAAGIGGAIVVAVAVVLLRTRRRKMPPTASEPARSSATGGPSAPG
jgi:hypothetical protein